MPDSTERPVITISKLEDGSGVFEIDIAGMFSDMFSDDPDIFGPGIPGILMSDLLDHLATALHQVNNRDISDIRREILKVMHDEDRFKKEEPSRGKILVNHH